MRGGEEVSSLQRAGELMNLLAVGFFPMSETFRKRCPPGFRSDAQSCMKLFGSAGFLRVPATSGAFRDSTDSRNQNNGVGGVVAGSASSHPACNH